MRPIWDRIYQQLYERGFVVAKKWSGLGNEPVGDKKRREFTKYLDLDHPGRRLYTELVKRYRPERILEIGSGGMHELRQLHRDQVVPHQVHYSLMDVAEKFLDEGRREFPNVSMKIGNINKPVAKENHNAYDWVYCRHLIEHQPYYMKPILNMREMSRSLVLINCFRWTFGNDTITSSPYYSNKYNIFELYQFLRDNFERVQACIVFKEGGNFGPRHTRETVPVVQRTRDHLLFFCYKNLSCHLKLDEVAEKSGIQILENPYSDILERMDH